MEIEYLEVSQSSIGDSVLGGKLVLDFTWYLVGMAQGFIGIKGDFMRSYPTALEVPNRKQRKAQRKAIFEENRLGNSAARRARRDARKPGAKK